MSGGPPGRPPVAVAQLGDDAATAEGSNEPSGSRFGRNVSKIAPLFDPPTNPSPRTEGAAGSSELPAQSSSPLFEASARLDTADNPNVLGTVRLWPTTLEWTDGGNGITFDLAHVKATHAGRRARATLQLVLYSGKEHVFDLTDEASSDSSVATRDSLHAALKKQLGAQPKRGVLDKELLRVLCSSDHDKLVNAVQRGDIRLLNPAWLKKQPPDYRIQYRQELEQLEKKLEAEGKSPLPLLKPDQAVKLIESGERSVGALSYGWLVGGDPDPDGARFRVVQRALKDMKVIRGLFWDFASCYQDPPGGKRTAEERASFDRALKVMGDVYASVVGTTVLQLTHDLPLPTYPILTSPCCYR